ncbi:MAG: hypothetical protein ACK5KN_15500 [Dysgonomonas sp.]|jgi:hypothetical protein|uniref:hypothetical protein n=1 Tax=unclassified Dysgonomonas TaxID=2630389 RepID=UPI0025C02E8A|nr:MULTISPECIES: hypothetical protein [unclassified Dysgonomonas]MDR1714717.1 hypothetical protein [Prevotella sp.]MDR2002872.1 hypothetical protein [Prevotella sp.]HMM04432.1 hypothetical protein [Dysgonomonas sp.]
MKLNDESGNKSVITTRYVLDANSLITYVVYDEDGDWQFFSDEDITESDACVVSVKQILELDDSLNELDLKPGQAAERSDADAPWQTIKQKSSRDNSFLKEDDDN